MPKLHSAIQVATDKPPPSLIAMARQMVRDGYGYDDIAYRLNISMESARSFVFGPRKKARP